MREIVRFYLADKAWLQCLDVLGPNSTPENLREDFITATTSQLDDYFNRLSEREGG